MKWPPQCPPSSATERVTYSLQIQSCSERHCPDHHCVHPTDLDRRSQNLRHLYPVMGLQLGVFMFFPNQNKHDSSEAYELQSELEDKHAWNPAQHAKIVDAFVCVCFQACGWQKHKYLRWSSMADNAITQSGIGVLGSPFYICGSPTVQRSLNLVLLREWTRHHYALTLIYPTPWISFLLERWDIHLLTSIS